MVLGIQKRNFKLQNFEGTGRPRMLVPEENVTDMRKMFDEDEDEGVIPPD